MMSKEKGTAIRRYTNEVGVDELQIAIFVLPMMVLVGWAINRPFLLDIEPFAALVLTLSVIHTYFVSSDGNSNW
jgi:Ca2+:H+ antiporter